MGSYMEFFSIARVILMFAWILVAALYFKSDKKYRDEIRTDLKGQDGKWQAKELAAWYWFKFFPWLFLLTLLMIIVDLPFNDYTEGLMITVWTATNGIFAVTIAGAAWGKDQNKGKEKKNEHESIPRRR